MKKLDPVSFMMGAESGGGGVTDYDGLSGKPQINGVTLSGNKSAADLGLAASGAEANVIDGITVNGDAVTVTNKIAALTVPERVSDLQNDAGYQDAQQVEDAIDVKVSGVYRASDSAANVAALPALTKDNVGRVANMLNDFITTADFVEGAGKMFPAGTNVVITDSVSGGYKYDVLAGFVDLSGKQDKLPVTGAANRGAYISADGVVSPMAHTLDKDVPADAKLTDTVTPVDAALSNSGEAADAKAAGDKIAALESENALLRELLQGVDAPIYREKSGNPAIFDDGAAANVKSLSVKIAPAQSGTGDPSPENIRPISGAASVTVTRAGKNLFPYEAWKNVSTWNGASVFENNGVTITSSTGDCYTLYSENEYPAAARVPVRAGERLILSWECDADAIGTVYVFGNGDTSKNVFASASAQTRSYTVPDDVTYLTLRFGVGRAGTTISYRNIMVRYADGDGEFEPYQGQSVTVSPADSGGPPAVYGGTLNVTTGELTVTHRRYDAGQIGNMGGNSNAGGLGWKDFPDILSKSSNPAVDERYVLSSMFPYVANGWTSAVPCVSTENTGTRIRIYAEHGNFAELYPDFELVAKLAAPLTFRLAPAQLATLSGYNAVSTDAESVSVEYQSNYGGAKALTFTDIAAASPVGEQHRMVFGGRDLGTSVTAAHIAAVRDGSFLGLLVGDYWTINGVTWRIVDMDYWYGCGNTPFNRHHLVVMPDSVLTDAKMNDTDTATGGYTGSKMYTDTLPTVKATCAAAFPDMILTHRDWLVNAVTDGSPSAGSWVDSSVELASEIMMYGTRVISPGNNGANVAGLYTINKRQLALFSLAPAFIKPSSGWSWLRDPVSASAFAGANAYGGGLASYAVASNNGGVRPVFAVG